MEPLEHPIWQLFFILFFFCFRHSTVKGDKCLFMWVARRWILFRISGKLLITLKLLIFRRLIARRLLVSGWRLTGKLLVPWRWLYSQRWCILGFNGVEGSSSLINCSFLHNGSERRLYFLNIGGISWLEFFLQVLIFSQKYLILLL